MYELKSYAKINLGLEIIGKRSNGYHNLKTIFQTVDFFDTIHIKENTSGEIRLKGDDSSIEWDERNTIVKAFEKIYGNYSVKGGFDIFVEKHIPSGAGLGGGSINAAVILLFLERFFNLSIPANDMNEMAVQIGADVPFFLTGGTALAEGIGEKITPLEDIEEFDCDIVIPGIKVITKHIFSNFILTSTPIISKIDTFINSGKKKILVNNLEKATFELFPEVEIVKNKMKKFGYELVLMSGSGSSVYGITDKKDSSAIETDRLNRYSVLSNEFSGSRVVITRTIDRNSYRKNIGASPSGKASVFGADTRRFESSRPSLYIK